MQWVRVRTKAPASRYDIKIGRNILANAGEDVRTWLGDVAQRIALVSNPTIYTLHASQISHSLRTQGFLVSYHLVGDGERFKSLKTTREILNFLTYSKVERTDAVLALGGGVVGDVTGFAASIYLRGIAFINVPTTLLSQIDSSVGGKTGVNLPSGKNLVGTFHQPRGVVVDLDTLKTLPARELTAGCCEALKQGAIASSRLFGDTLKFLRELNSNRATLSTPETAKLIAAHCKFKAEVVSKDPFEDQARTDRYSRRVLNFGHTIGHALEQVTNYRRFKHGEAVGVGMLAAGEISRNLGLLPSLELESLAEGVSLCGQLPRTDDLDVSAILEAAMHDKKKVAGNIQWVVLERIGKPRIVSGKDITRSVLRRSVRSALDRAAKLRK